MADLALIEDAGAAEPSEALSEGTLETDSPLSTWTVSASGWVTDADRVAAAAVWIAPLVVVTRGARLKIDAGITAAAPGEGAVVDGVTLVWADPLSPTEGIGEPATTGLLAEVEEVGSAAELGAACNSAFNRPVNGDASLPTVAMSPAVVPPRSPGVAMVETGDGAATVCIELWIGGLAMGGAGLRKRRCVPSNRRAKSQNLVNYLYLLSFL